MIRNGLPDVLDLLIVCLESGCSLDQAILKSGEELALAYKPLGDELALVANEIRAGKPRAEAFRRFAERTCIDDVRSMVAMLVQTDRYGTSLAEALRVHADLFRTRRRQRAEERAAKAGVKLVVPASKPTATKTPERPINRSGDIVLVLHRHDFSNRHDADEL